MTSTILSASLQSGQLGGEAAELNTVGREAKTVLSASANTTSATPKPKTQNAFFLPIGNLVGVS